MYTPLAGPTSKLNLEWMNHTFLSMGMIMRHKFRATTKLSSIACTMFHYIKPGFKAIADGVIREKHWVIMLDWCSFLLVNMFNIRLTLNTCVIYATQRTLPVPVGILKHLKIQSTEFVKSQRKKPFFFLQGTIYIKISIHV